MVLTLHIWGPAFGVASIDAECLAAAELLDHVVPRGQWSLVASNDTAFNSYHTLPALVDDNGTWVSGYTNIVIYLRETAGIEIDNDLTPLQAADAAACAAYLSTRGSALLALALYVSHSAWVGLTRPAYSKLLPFPLTWTIPPAVRAAAIERVQHLGLAHLASSVDDLDEQSSSPSAGSGSGASTTATGFLQLPARFGPSRTMQPEQTAAIRLQSLSEDFFSVIHEYRACGGGGGFLFGRAAPSSVDFLVFAYLRLMRVETPQPFLRSAMRKSYPQLWAFSEPRHLLQQARPVTTKQEEVDTDSDGFPWQDPSPRSVVGLLGKFADGAIGHIPSVGQTWTRFRQGGGSSSAYADNDNENTSSDSSTLQLALTLGATLTAGLAAAGVAVFAKGLAPLGAAVHTFEASPTREDDGRNSTNGSSKFNRYGNDIGAMLEHLPDL